MAKLYVIARDRNSITYGVQNYPDLTMVVKANRSPKTAAGGKKLINAVSEVQINATVSVPSCGTGSTDCAQESLSHRRRLSGSMQNAAKRVAMDQIAEAVAAATAPAFRAGESFLLPDTVAIDAAVAVLYPPK